MHIVDNLRPIFKKEYKEKRVVIKDRYGNKRKYLLGVSENDYGILFLLNDLNNPCHNYAKGALDKKDNSPWEFTVEVSSDKYKNIGYGTFIMRILVKWVLKNNIKSIYGFLSPEDRKNGNWNVSLPFYENLPNKIKHIKKCFFVSTIEDISQQRNFSNSI